MKKQLQLVIDLIENSTTYDLGLIDFKNDGNYITVFGKDHRAFHATSLIASIASIDRVNSYVDYDQELQKVVLRVF